MKTHLVIGDSHAKPRQSLERFTWLGKLIADIRPDVVIDIGDSADMASLCSHSSNREQRLASYRDDLSAYHEAKDRIATEIRKRKKKQPRWVKVLGNHENRITKFIDENPVFEGAIALSDLGSERWGWEVYPFLEAVDIDGIDYCHYFPSGVLNRPIGGDHPAFSILKKRFKSSVAGHDHRLDYKCLRTTGRSLAGLVAGCYIDEDMEYAGPANALWSSGIALLSVYDDAFFDLNWLSIERIKKQYAR